MGSTRVSLVPHNPDSLPKFARSPSFPFEGDLRIKRLAEPVDVEPPRKGEDAAECVACNAPDEAYIWVSERWRVRATDRPSGLPVVLILESRSHLDLGDLPNMLAAELGVMTVRLERAIRSLDGVARVHVNRWGDGWAHLHMWFLARPHGHLQLRGTFLPVWDAILPPISEAKWRENLALVAAWLAEFGGRALAEPPRIEWRAPSQLSEHVAEISELLERNTDLHDAAQPSGQPDGQPDGQAGGQADGQADGQAGGTENDRLGPAEITVAEPGRPGSADLSPVATPVAADVELPPSDAGPTAPQRGGDPTAPAHPAEGQSGALRPAVPTQRAPAEHLGVDAKSEPTSA